MDLFEYNVMVAWTDIETNVRTITWISVKAGNVFLAGRTAINEMNAARPRSNPVAVKIVRVTPYA